MNIKKYPSQTIVKALFDYDPSGHLVWRKSRGRIAAGQIAGSLLTTGYRQIRINRQFFRSNRLTWIWHNGDIPDGLLVDHINSTPSDDRIENLTLLTNRQNTTKGALRGKRCWLPLGVRQISRNSFCARYRIGGVQHQSKPFKTAAEAHRAYLEAISNHA